MNFHDVQEEKARWEQQIEFTYSFKQILETAPHETATV